MRLEHPADAAEALSESAFPDVRDRVHALASWVAEGVIGRDTVIQALFIALLTEGHVLLEGPPGLAKTRIAQRFAATVEGKFRRIQFTPDLLPGDLTGTEILEPGTHALIFRPGPVFCNVLLADEINRAPAKVQSALLEAMEERQVTAGDTTHKLAPPFIVLATQNPIEHDGTWDLPQAQFDRFMMRVPIGYPTLGHERAILDLTLGEAARTHPQTSPPLPMSAETLSAGRAAVAAVHLSDIVRDYVVRLVDGTRTGTGLRHDVATHLSHAVSPRGTIMLARASQARAWLMGRDHVLPEDIAALAPLVLGHRMGLSYRAEADGITTDSLVARLLETVDVV